MFKLTLIPLFFIFGGIIFSLLGFYLYRKVKRGIKYTYNKSNELSSHYIDKWRSQEQRKKLPDIVQKGFDDYQVIEDAIKQLPPVWQLKLIPLRKKSHELLLTISQHLIEDENFERSKLSSLRSFFNQSLDAFKQFSLKLLSDHDSLTKAEQQRAKDNIQLIYNDILKHENKLKDKRKLDFDILMDVIKARLK